MDVAVRLVEVASGGAVGASAGAGTAPVDVAVVGVCGATSSQVAGLRTALHLAAALREAGSGSSSATSRVLEARVVAGSAPSVVATLDAALVGDVSSGSGGGDAAAAATAAAGSGGGAAIEGAAAAGRKRAAVECVDGAGVRVVAVNADHWTTPGPREGDLAAARAAAEEAAATADAEDVAETADGDVWAAPGQMPRGAGVGAAGLRAAYDAAGAAAALGHAVFADVLERGCGAKHVLLVCNVKAAGAGDGKSPVLWAPLADGPAAIDADEDNIRGLRARLDALPNARRLAPDTQLDGSGVLSTLIACLVTAAACAVTLVAVPLDDQRSRSQRAISCASAATLVTALLDAHPQLALGAEKARTTSKADSATKGGLQLAPSLQRIQDHSDDYYA